MCRSCRGQQPEAEHGGWKESVDSLFLINRPRILNGFLALRVLCRRNSAAMSARLNSLSTIYRRMERNTRRLLPRATRCQANTTIKFVELEGNRIGRNGGEVGGTEVSQRPVPQLNITSITEAYSCEALNVWPSVIVCLGCRLVARSSC